MRIIIEPHIKPYAADLYHAAIVEPSFRGFESIDSEALARYDTDGYLAVRQAFPQPLINGAVKELDEMMHSDDPRCESIYFESTIRKHLSGDATLFRDQTESIPQLPA